MDVKLLEQGDFFKVTTEKVVPLVEGSPWKAMLKRSTYHIVTGESMRKLVGKPNLDYDRYNDDFDGKMAWSRNTKREYVIAAIDRAAGFGTSEYVPISDVTGQPRIGVSYQKRQVRQYLPSDGEFGNTFLIGVDTITALEPKSVRLSGAKVADNLPF